MRTFVFNSLESYKLSGFEQAESDEQMKQELVPNDDAQISSESDRQSETALDLEPSQNALEDVPSSKMKSTLRTYEKKYEQLQEFVSKHQGIIRRAFQCILLTGYFCMLIAACILNFKKALALLLITLVAIFFYCWDLFMETHEERIAEYFASHGKMFKAHKLVIKLVFYGALVTFIILWLALDTWKEGASQLISFSGLCILIIFMFIFSKYPGKVQWRTICWGLCLQFVLGLIIMRTQSGLHAFEWMGIQVKTFLDYADAGSKFIFGEVYREHFFAFKVLPIVIFFSTVISILYFLGFIQWLILKIGWIMQITMGTSPTESLVAASNIFVGQTESPLIIRPYIKDLTLSEIHSVMSSGFSTIAGSVLGAYVSFGIPASHLLTASVMSAPASLAVAKLFWPETEEIKLTTKSNIKMDRVEAKNIIEAACTGAGASISLVANIAVNLIAFLSCLAFVNAVLSWLGNMFDEPDLSFELICSYIFMPLAFLMGVDWDDSFMVGELLGIKTFFNEFLAYQRLSALISKRTEGHPEYIDGSKQYLSVRSEAIATYALCGFANFGSVGIVIGGLTSMAPSRFREIAAVSMRALISGTVACFMTACMAGMIAKTLLPIICSRRGKIDSFC
ncbi:solute carrier family 28 member 3-like [Pristis pectinata]|uniref:solute carrier family 28 member 3-like n=1 Tax=Pristis pectinata TaxID=685728 RepID=UPI00223CA64F|nr:solute carrier family 28 member 3-like [Pristis pectinata]